MTPDTRLKMRRLKRRDHSDLEVSLWRKGKGATGPRYFVVVSGASENLGRAQLVWLIQAIEAIEGLQWQYMAARAERIAERKKSE